MERIIVTPLGRELLQSADVEKAVRIPMFSWLFSMKEFVVLNIICNWSPSTSLASVSMIVYVIFHLLNSQASVAY